LAQDEKESLRHQLNSNIMQDDQMQSNEFNDFKSYIKWVKDAKKKKLLHQEVEKRLASLLSKIYSDSYQISEVSGIPGGRNDLMQFSFSGRRVVIELFFSTSQVSQDLRLLEQSNADIKIAILLDEAIDPHLSWEYFRKKPEPFPFIDLRFVMLPEYEKFCLARLKELIDEKSPIIQMRQILSHPLGERLEEQFKKQLSEIKFKLPLNEKNSGKNSDITGKELIALLIIRKIKKLGVPTERLRSLFEFLLSSYDHTFMIISHGMQAFLITDLNGQHAIYADADLADDLIICGEKDDDAYIVICLNKFLNDFYTEQGLPYLPVKLHFSHCYRELEELWPEIEKRLNELKDKNFKDSRTGEAHPAT
jgi:hypothetical protein